MRRERERERGKVKKDRREKKRGKKREGERKEEKREKSRKEKRINRKDEKVGMNKMGTLWNVVQAPSLCFFASLLRKNCTCTLQSSPAE